MSPFHRKIGTKTTEQQQGNTAQRKRIGLSQMADKKPEAAPRKTELVEVFRVSIAFYCYRPRKTHSHQSFYEYLFCFFFVKRFSGGQKLLNEGPSSYLSRELGSSGGM
ncbi:hypothetical protein HJC23_001500 [Cyclotella cryptica]|uniref:Uncharacterized protein n=1 Tax=Cyclotella cryptica TaxID=29204 RepID=A0ABD3NNC1_9STRA